MTLRRGPARSGAARATPGAALSVSELFRAHHLELVRLAVVMVTPETP
jgi:hypothetical protein